MSSLWHGLWAACACVSAATPVARTDSHWVLASAAATPVVAPTVLAEAQIQDRTVPESTSLEQLRAQASRLFRADSHNDFSTGKQATQTDRQASRAAWILGLLTLHGNGVRIDPVTAEGWFREAFQNGEPLASAGMAWCAIEGCSGASDLTQARTWIHALRPFDPGRARYLDWWLAMRARVIEPEEWSSEPEALEKIHELLHRDWLVEAADMGDVQAQIELGLDSAATGKLQEALRFFNQAAKKSAIARSNAQLILARMDELKREIQPGDTVSSKGSTSVASDSAAGQPKSEQAQALFEQARKFHRGDGVPANFSQALRDYQRANELGSVEAKRMLALIYSVPSTDGPVNLRWMQELARVDLSWLRMVGSAHVAPEYMLREPTPLYDYLPAPWRQQRPDVVSP